MAKTTFQKIIDETNLGLADFDKILEDLNKYQIILSIGETVVNFPKTFFTFGNKGDFGKAIIKKFTQKRDFFS